MSASESGEHGKRVIAERAEARIARHGIHEANKNIDEIMVVVERGVERVVAVDREDGAEVVVHEGLRLVPAEASGVEEELAPAPDEEGVDGDEEDSGTAAPMRTALIRPLEEAELPAGSPAASGSTSMSSGQKRRIVSAARA